MSNFALFIVALFILAAALRVDFFFTIVYFFAGVYILSRVWSNRMVNQIVTSRHLEKRAFVGDEVRVTLTVENNGWLPIPWLMVHESYPLEISLTPFFREVVSLGSRARRVFKYRLLARRRGYYTIGPMRVQTGDLLGLGRQQSGQLAADYLIVYPKILSMPELGLPTHSPQVTLATPIPIFEDPSRIMGVRDYHWGDNPRHIHWTATAATGQTMVKQFQPAIARESAIFLNMIAADYERAEQISAVELAVTVAASLANHMIMIEKLPVALNALAHDPLTGEEQHFRLPPGKERGQLLQILEVLARIQPVETGDFLGSLRQEAVRLTWGATLIIITNRESEPLIQTLLWLQHTGFNPSVVLVGPKRPRQFITTRQIPIFEVWQDKDISTWSPRL